MKIVIAIIIFSVVILIHELGHFLLAKKNKIEVLEFSLGLGPTLISTTKGGTKYSLKLLPFGGACQMKGEDFEEGVEPGTFNSASVWGRISVVAAGPIFNFLLAFVLAVIIVAFIGYVPARVTAVQEGSPVQEAGLREGDMITEYNGYHIDIGNDLYSYLGLTEQGDGPITLSYEREGVEHTVTYQPQVDKSYLLGVLFDGNSDTMEVSSLIHNMPMEEAGVREGDLITAINGQRVEGRAAYQKYLESNPLGKEPVKVTILRDGEEKTISITPRLYTEVNRGFAYNLASEKTTAWNVLKYGAIEVKYWIRTTVMSLKMLITGQFGVKDLSGPVGVVDVIGKAYTESKSEGALMVWMNMLNMAILLSANLGVMNLLPLPALDGGRLVFLLIEAVCRRPVNRKVEGMIHFAGLMLLMLLMVYVMYNDILRII